MTALSERRITPWVGRLLAINAVVLLVQQVFFRGDEFSAFFGFDPGLSFLHRPWTFFTYMFVHGGLFHLLANSIGLFVFGPPVERRMGSAGFITFYIYCGVLAAAFSLLVQSLMPQPLFVGASGAILGVAFAFARFAPDAEIMIFPFPVPIRASRFIWVLLGLDVIGALWLHDDIAHLAHIGGFAAAWLYFSVQQIARPIDAPRLPSFRPRATVSVSADDNNGRQSVRSRLPVQEVAPTPTPMDLQAAEALEVDRVLDKIHATGINSLTADERRFLDNVAHRRRTDEKH